MPTGLPPWVAHPPPDDRDRISQMSPNERLERFAQACALAESILAGRPDRAEVLARRDERSPESERLWRSLVAKARSARTTR